MTQYITLIDFILFPFIFLIIWRIAVVLRNKHFSRGHILRPYFIPALLLKIIGSVAFAAVYQFYYGYGDTFGYYNMGNFFTQILKDNPLDFLTIYFTGGDAYFLPKSYVYNFDYLYNHHIATIIVSRFSSFIGLITFGNYLLITVGFSILSFSGLWKLFRLFATLYPAIVKQLAWCILFVPSVIFWGSGLLKDSITLGAIGWLTFACWSLFFLKKRIKASILIIIITIWTLIQIKAYILLSFLPGLLIWVGALYYKKIQNKQLQILMWPFFILILSFIAIQASGLIAKENKALSLEEITTTALGTGATLQQYDAGSTYDLGIKSASFGAILVNSPLAVITTLFRPFVWEVKNVVMLFSALESFGILILTALMLFKTGLLKAIKITFSKSIVFFCFIFAIVFSIGVALSSGNFGTLVRYKLPAMPFYLVFLLLLYYYGNLMKGREIKGVRRKKTSLATLAAS